MTSGSSPQYKVLRAIGMYGYHAEQAPCQRQRYLPTRREALLDKGMGKAGGSTTLHGAPGMLPTGWHTVHKLTACPGRCRACHRAPFPLSHGIRMAFRLLTDSAGPGTVLALSGRGGGTSPQQETDESPMYAGHKTKRGSTMRTVIGSHEEGSVATVETSGAEDTAPPPSRRHCPT